MTAYSHRGSSWHTQQTALTPPGPCWRTRRRSISRLWDKYTAAGVDKYLENLPRSEKDQICSTAVRPELLRKLLTAPSQKRGGGQRCSSWCEVWGLGVLQRFAQRDKHTVNITHLEMYKRAGAQRAHVAGWLECKLFAKMFRKFLNVRIWCIYFVPDRRWTNQDALEHQNLPLNSHWASSLQYCSFSCYRRTDICHISLLVIQPNYDTATKKVTINPVTRYYLILILKVPYLRNCHLLNSNGKRLWGSGSPESPLTDANFRRY